jgi:hypothetical protein
MKYTPQTIRHDISKLGYTSWDWGGTTPGVIRADLLRQNPRLRQTRTTAQKNRAFQEELAEYCWAAYNRALTSIGQMVIGRSNHLSWAGLFDKVSEMTGSDTLFNRGAQGNLLQMDKWAKVVNDAWVLGGIHRQAVFRLASPLAIQNLWNPSGGYFVVTARELTGLLHFGYEYQRVGPWQVLSSKNYVKATTADLVKYDKHIRKVESVQAAQRLLVL